MVGWTFGALLGAPVASDVGFVIRTADGGPVGWPDGMSVGFELGCELGLAVRSSGTKLSGVPALVVEGSSEVVTPDKAVVVGVVLSVCSEVCWSIVEETGSDSSRALVTEIVDC
jgi:hypothetical protein